MSTVSANEAPPHVVVFDLGGVLIDWSPRRLYRKLFADSTQMEWFLANVCTQAWHEQVDAGARPEDIVPPLQRQHPTWAAEIAAFYDRFPEMFGAPHQAMVDVLEHLDAGGVRLYALTNWGARSFAWARTEYAFLARFRDIVVSGEEHLLKPDPRLFQVLFRRGGFAPAHALFIDDHAPNVAAALALGMRSVHHQEAPTTIRALQAAGLVL